MSYGGSAQFSNPKSATPFPNVQGAEFSGGQGALQGTTTSLGQIGRAGRLNQKLEEAIANDFGNGKFFDPALKLQRTGGLSVQGGGGGGGGFAGGGAGASIATLPKSSTGGGGGSVYVDSS